MADLIDPRALAQNTQFFRQAIADLEPGEEVLFAGLELAPSIVLSAYCAGVFPMGLGDHGVPPYGWFSPDPRGVLADCRAHVSRSLRKHLKHFTVTVDECFEPVMRACADERRDGRWITAEVIAAYLQLHQLGHAHSVEIWQADQLVGGLYGVNMGSLFAGESMFYRASGASKIAVAAAATIVRTGQRPIFDVQWRTDHLATLGVREVDRESYLAVLPQATQSLGPQWSDWCGRRFQPVWSEGSFGLQEISKLK